ncbi:hypothetical protein [Ruixingdingia sedimenti]|uniref:Uncharacterized protein n=1 Tax=Ruixingdingia sedimenti TaxID=3073604 RepID=A0ABU1FEJ6_9RHOB|nr:hypothetical protein [Xinfangfangia sp. LG-4]MDR5654894.1 hypothetical protein [Xinfangfangia sp. LG-4]
MQTIDGEWLDGRPVRVITDFYHATSRYAHAFCNAEAGRFTHESIATTFGLSAEQYEAMMNATEGDDKTAAIFYAMAAFIEAPSAHARLLVLAAHRARQAAP